MYKKLKIYPGLCPNETLEVILHQKQKSPNHRDALVDNPQWSKLLKYRDHFHFITYYYQGIYKNRVKNNRNFFEIPALLSCKRGNPERENSK